MLHVYFTTLCESVVANNDVVLIALEEQIKQPSKACKQTINQPRCW